MKKKTETKIVFEAGPMRIFYEPGTSSALIERTDFGPLNLDPGAARDLIQALQEVAELMLAAASKEQDEWAKENGMVIF